MTLDVWTCEVLGRFVLCVDFLYLSQKKYSKSISADGRRKERLGVRQVWREARKGYQLAVLTVRLV